MCCSVPTTYALDRTDFASWQQQMRLSLSGVPDASSLLDYHLKIKGKVQVDIRATNSTSTGCTKDIYSLFNHLPCAKEYGTYVMLLMEEALREDSIYDQLMLYLRAARGNGFFPMRTICVGRFINTTVDPLALISNVATQLYNSHSSSNPSSTYFTHTVLDNSQT
ncbi:hypothetical protein Tco_1505652 [Tanacetum coccineum]